MNRYVIYTRVSTEEQGRSGLGLEAQERDIAHFLAGVPHEIIGEFRDIESGKADDRPELAKALKLARYTGAELLVSKLDRLSRDVAFIAAIMKDRKLTLRVAQMPSADNFQLHIYAALAEQERSLISQRTRAALQAAKARGVKLGGARDKTMARNAAIAAKADQDAARAMKMIAPLQAAGQSLNAIADALNEARFPTARGGRWTAKQVSRIVARTAA